MSGKVHTRMVLLLGAGACLALGGCWTSKEHGDALRKDVDQLKKELATAQQQSKEERIKLQKVLEQATALLTRNSADVGAAVERMQARLNRMSGTVEENKVGLKEVQEGLRDISAKASVKGDGPAAANAGKLPDDKDALFDQAKAKYEAGSHQEGRRLLRHFINRHGDDPRIDQAQMMVGASYFSEQKFPPAIVELKKIIDKHKDSKLVPDALFMIGMSFYQLKFCTDAEPFLSQILKKYPKHAQVARAKKVLGLIKRYRRNRSVCGP